MLLANKYTSTQSIVSWRLLLDTVLKSSTWPAYQRCFCCWAFSLFLASRHCQEQWKPSQVPRLVLGLDSDFCPKLTVEDRPVCFLSYQWGRWRQTSWESIWLSSCKSWARVCSTAHGEFSQNIDRLIVCVAYYSHVMDSVTWWARDCWLEVRLCRNNSTNNRLDAIDRLHCLQLR